MSYPYRRRPARRPSSGTPYILAILGLGVLAMAIWAYVDHRAGPAGPSAAAQPPQAPAQPMTADAAGDEVRSPPGSAAWTRRDEAPPTAIAPSGTAPVPGLPSRPGTAPGGARDQRPLYHEPAATPHPLRTWSFTVPSTMAGIRSLTASASIPLGADGMPLPSAQDIVAVFPFPTERNALSGFAAAFAQRWGFSILTVHFPLHPSGDPVDPAHFYYYPESGSDQVWLSALATLRSALGAPSSRRMLAFGRSGGGAAALHFANAHPDQVEAIIAEAPRAIPAHPRIRCPVLLVHGEDDYVRDANLQMEASLRRLGTYVLRATYHPAYEKREAGSVAFSHGADAPTIALMESWLGDIANARIDREQNRTSSWSVRSGSTTPFPGERSAEAWGDLPPETLNRNGALIALPARNRTPKGRIILLGEGLTVLPDELRYGVQQVADSGYIAVSVGADGSTSSKAIVRALDALDAAGAAGGLPAFIISLDEASDQAPVTSCRFEGAVLAGLSSRGWAAVPDWHARIAKLGIVGIAQAPAGGALPGSIMYRTSPGIAAARHRPRLLHTRQIAAAVQLIDAWLVR